MIKAAELIDYCLTGGAISAEIAPQLSDPAYRESIYRILHQRPILPVLAPLLHTLWQLEGQEHDDAFYENVYWCALLLYRLGDVTDSAEIWAWKRTDFDRWCGVDGQFLVGAGVEQTIAFFEARGDAESREAAAYLRDLRDGGDLTPEELAIWLAYRQRYFADA